MYLYLKSLRVWLLALLRYTCMGLQKACVFKDLSCKLISTKKSALQQVSDECFMSSIWREMYINTPRKKRKGSGIDGQSLEDFNLNFEDNIKSISLSLRNHEYKPLGLKPFCLPKVGSSKLRIICVPTVTDRLVQRCILRFLNNKGHTLANSISYGFIHGFSKAVDSALQKARQLRTDRNWAYKADISSFFDRINRSEIELIIKKKVRYRSLHELIKQFVHVEIQADPNDLRVIRRQGIVNGEGLRQGMPISPYLANLYLESFDQSIIQKNIKMIRYADDLIAFANDETECKKIHEYCKEQLAKLFLDIHDIDRKNNSKTSIAGPNQDIEFLGLTLSPRESGYEIIVSRGQIGKIKTKLHEFSNLNYCFKNEVNLSNIAHKLDSKIAGYIDAYSSAENKKQLEDILLSCRKQVLKDLFITLGIDLDTLSRNKKKFLGLHI